jgi:hypothetical protein
VHVGGELHRWGGGGGLFTKGNINVQMPELEAVGLRPLFLWMDQLLFNVVKGCDILLNCFVGRLSTFAKHSVVNNR